MCIETIYAWVTGPGHSQVQVVAPDDTVLFDTSKMEPWLLDQETTNKICWHGIGHQGATARAVMDELGWAANWSPVYDQLWPEVKRICQRDGVKGASPHRIIDWSQEHRDENLICVQNGFAVWRVAEDLVEGWCLAQEVQS